jgi:hypothetical protein
MLKNIGYEYSNIPTPILQIFDSYFFERLNMTGS